MTATPLGIIIVDHGSKRESANAMLDAFVEQFAKMHEAEIVEVAHMELAEPSVAQAFAACVSRGARAVVVCPYFLSPGRHSQKDIPELVEAAAKDFPGVAYHVAEPIGLHPLMLKVIDDRVSQGREQIQGSPDGARPKPPSTVRMDPTT